MADTIDPAKVQTDIDPNGVVVDTAAPAQPSTSNSLVRGVKQAFIGLKGTAGLAEGVGNLAGLPSLAEFGKSAAENAQTQSAALGAPTDTLSGVHSLSDAGSWVMNKVGSNLPVLAAAGAGFLVGGPIGAAVGGGLAAGAPAAGEITHEATKEGLSAPLLRGVVGGGVEGALGALPVGRLFGGTAAKTVGREMLTQGLINSGVGMATNEVNRVALDQPLTSSEALSQALDAGAAGFAVGGIMGGIHQKIALKQAADAASRDVATNTPDAPAPEQPAPAAQLGYDPRVTDANDIIAAPDGSAMRRGEVETYIASLPADQQFAARAKWQMGMGEQPLPPEPSAVPEAAQVTPQEIDRTIAETTPRPQAPDNKLPGGMENNPEFNVLSTLEANKPVVTAKPFPTIEGLPPEEVPISSADHPLRQQIAALKGDARTRAQDDVALAKAMQADDPIAAVEKLTSGMSKSTVKYEVADKVLTQLKAEQGGKEAPISGETNVDQAAKTLESKPQEAPEKAAEPSAPITDPAKLSESSSVVRGSSGELVRADSPEAADIAKAAVDPVQGTADRIDAELARLNDPTRSKNGMSQNALGQEETNKQDLADFRRVLAAERAKKQPNQELINNIVGYANDILDGKSTSNAEYDAAERNPQMQLAIFRSGGDLNKVLQHVKDNDADPGFKALADRLMGLDIGATISHGGEAPAGIVGKQTMDAEGQNHVTIFNGGESTHTVMHEATHAATVARLAYAEKLVSTGLKPANQQEARLVQGFKDLEDIRQLAIDNGLSDYGLKNAKEFVAELHTNADFQTKLSGITVDGRSLFKRVVDAIAKMLGFQSDNKSVDALSKALDLSEGFFSNDKLNQFSESNMEKSPQAAFDQTDGMMERAVKFASDKIQSLSHTATLQALHWSSLNNIVQHTGFREAVAPEFQGWGDRYTAAMDSIQPAIQERGKQAADIARSMAALKDVGSGTERKLYDLMGQSTMKGVFPDRPFESQTWLKPADRADYQRLKNMYESHPDVKSAYDAALQYNKEDYDRTYATVVMNLGYRSDMPPELWQKIDVTKGKTAEVAAVEDWLKQNGQQEAIDGLRNQYSEKQNAPYFHLGRSGSFFTRFDIKNTPEARAAYEQAMGISPLSSRAITEADNHVFARYEEIGEYNDVAKKLQALATAGHIEPDFSSGKLETMSDALDRTSPPFIRAILANIDASENFADAQSKEEAKAVIRRLAVDMTPETSGSKAFAQRKSVAGYDVDMRRNFEKRAASTAYFVAHNSIRPEIEGALNTLKEGVMDRQNGASPNYDTDKGLTAAAILDEMKQRQSNTLLAVHTPIQNNIRVASNSFFLAANPAFFMMKTLQPWQLTLPYLGGRHGFVNSFKEMTGATADAMSIIKDTIGDGWKGDKWHGILDADITVDRSKLPEPDKNFMKALVAAGGTTWTQGHDLGSVEAGGNQAFATANKAATASLHYSEAMDRMTAGLSAFRLEMKKNGGDVDAATKYGIQAVKDTMHDYSSHSLGRAFGKQGVAGKYTPLLTQFMQYEARTLELMGRLTLDAFGKIDPSMTSEQQVIATEQRNQARKQMAGMMATTSVLAGTMGLPFAGALTAAYNGVFSTKDQPADAAADYRNWLSDTFGQQAGEVIAHGALHAVGTDLGASHLGFDKLLPFTDFLNDRRKLQDRFDSGVLNMMGPTVGAGAGIAMGLQNMSQGRILKGMEQLVPSAVKGPLKAYDLAANGPTDIKGNKLSLPTPLNSWDIGMQALNATPSKLSEQKEATRDVATTQMLLQQRSSNLQEQLGKAVESGQQADIQQVITDITAFNKANPDMAIRNLSEGLRLRAMQRALGGQLGGVETGNKKLFPRLQEQTRFAQTGGMVPP